MPVSFDLTEDKYRSKALCFCSSESHTPVCCSAEVEMKTHEVLLDISDLLPLRAFQAFSHTEIAIPAPESRVRAFPPFSDKAMEQRGWRDKLECNTLSLSLSLVHTAVYSRIRAGRSAGLRRCTGVERSSTVPGLDFTVPTFYKESWRWRETGGSCSPTCAAPAFFCSGSSSAWMW